MRSMVEFLGDRLLSLVVPQVPAHAVTCNWYRCSWCIPGIRLVRTRQCCCSVNGCSCGACLVAPC
jgi:hypothetical protein